MSEATTDPSTVTHAGPAAVMPPKAETKQRFVLGVSGASGASYALRTLEQLLLAGHEVHLVVSDYGKRLLYDEADITRIDLPDLLPHLVRESDRPEPKAAASTSTGTRRAALSGLPAHAPDGYDAERDAGELESRLFIHPHKDVGAVIASGSFLHSGMVVLPCSSTSLGAIATSAGSNLLTRAAMVTLKERRPLIVCHRETPVNLVDIENMRTLTLAGAIVCPTNPGLYLRPRTIFEMIDFMAGKVLDLLHVEHGLDTRWRDEK
ncbi:MAG: UbiX family flavin prenyltransferase [Planctomycetota bacterium]